MTETPHSSPTHDHPSRVCAKCGHTNPPKRDLCEVCSAHLMLVCRQCGHRNPRSLVSCEKCGSRLRKTRAGKFKKWFWRGDAKIKPGEAVLALLVVAILYKASIFAINLLADFTR